MQKRNNYIIEYYKAFGKVPKFQEGFQFEDPLEVIFNLPPERALEWLKKRGENLKISINWDDLDAEAHDRAFTVAKVMSADLLQLIYDYVEEARREGWTLKQFQDNLLPKLESSGWTGAKPSRLKIIYDTNIQMAYSRGKYKQQKLIANLYPYWKYTQIQRPTKRHDHSLLDGKVFRHDDPIWDLIYPPSGFGCKCSVIPIKNGSRVENGSDYIEQIKSSEQFQLTPLKAWKPEADIYTEGIRRQLNEMLKKN